jgi:predicted Zn-dependent protease
MTKIYRTKLSELRKLIKEQKKNPWADIIYELIYMDWNEKNADNLLQALVEDYGMTKAEKIYGLIQTASNLRSELEHDIDSEEEQNLNQIVAKINGFLGFDINQ